MANRHEALISAALEAARLGFAKGEAPIGCVVALASGEIIASGHNAMFHSKNPTLHAEIVAFAAAAGKLVPGTKGMIMASTLEPCVMCTGAAMQCGIETIVYALKAPADSGTGRVSPPTSPGTTAPTVVGDVLADESRALFEDWMTRYKDDEMRVDQRKFIEQLLALT